MFFFISGGESVLNSVTHLLYQISGVLVWEMTHHDDFNPLGDWVWFVVLLFSQHTSKVTQLPYWTALTVLHGELNTHTDVHERTHADLGWAFPLRLRLGPHLQHQGDARREERHEDEVIGQYGHAAETTHDL